MPLLPPPKGFADSSFLFFFFFNHVFWSIIALQWCISFCFITKWISYTYTYIPISPPSCISLTPSLSHPSRWWQNTELISLCGCFPLASYFTFGSVYMSVPLSHFIPAYPSPPCVLKSILYVCVFIPVLPLCSSEPIFFFLDSIYMC